MIAERIRKAQRSRHFDMTSPDNDPADLQKSRTHEDFKDPGITYINPRFPNKTSSIVNLQHDKTTEYTTETLSRYLGETIPRTHAIIPRKSLVPFGGGSPEYVSIAQSSFTHATSPATLPPAGACADVSFVAGITGNSRSVDIIAGRDLPSASVYVPTSHRKRIPMSLPSGNDDPITFKPRQTLDPGFKTSHQIVHAANGTIPTLRSLGALRQ